jgi:hypothetical protein
MTIGLPYPAFAGDIGLTPLPLEYLGTTFTIVIGYILTAELLKV